jgi:hypothetical protein
MAVTWEAQLFVRQVVQAAGSGVLGQLVRPYPARPSSFPVAQATSVSSVAAIGRSQCT